MAFKRTDVAAACVLWVIARFAALIGLEQISMTVGAATRVSGINGRTTREQRNSWRWPAVVSQRAEHGVGVVPVAAVAESAGAIAAQVIAMRRDGAATICVRIVCDNAVLQRRCAVVKDTASRISANGAVIHCQVPRTIDDGATRSAAHSGTAISAIPGDGAVVQRHCAAEGVEGAANTHPAGDARTARGTGAIAGESTVFNYHQRASVVDAAAKSRAGSSVAV